MRYIAPPHRGAIQHPNNTRDNTLVSMRQARALLQSWALNQDSESTRHHANLSCRATYDIRVEGELGQEWAEWFEGMTITADPAGDTLLCGAQLDQAGLFGVLKKVRDLGMPLISVNRVQPVEMNQTKEDDG